MRYKKSYLYPLMYNLNVRHNSHSLDNGQEESLMFEHDLHATIATYTLISVFQIKRGSFIQIVHLMLLCLSPEAPFF